MSLEMCGLRTSEIELKARKMYHAFMLRDLNMIPLQTKYIMRMGFAQPEWSSRLKLCDLRFPILLLPPAYL